MAFLLLGDLWGISGNNTNAKFTKINLDFNDVMFLVSLILLFIAKAGHESSLECLSVKMVGFIMFLVFQTSVDIFKSKFEYF